MKRKMQGLLWLFLLEFALMVMSLEPGFLDFDNLPDTNFSCVGKVIGGYYADLETNCQMFHVCTIGQLDEPMDIRFLCLNGTVFDQETRVCERIDEVDCSKSEQFYSLNLELYGNTQPPILEESPEVEYPSDSRKTSTTVPPTSSTATSTFAPFFLNTPPTTTNRDISKIITSHHFPVNAPDIRFNPEEINISLKAGAPPDITRSQVPISYQQQSFSEKNTRVTVTTHTTIYKSEKQNRAPILSTTHPPVQSFTEKAETTLTPKSVVSYGLTHNKGSASNPTEITYGFSYPQTEESVEYHTEVPPHPYQYQLNINNFRPSAQAHPYHSSYRNSNKRQSKSNFPATTYRNHPAFTSSPKVPVVHRYQSQTEKPPNLQLPLPLLPTLPPLTFSSPSPFRHHIETKRYTKDHQSAPRIIISASASVSDNNGRRLNYSLGTIGASHFLGSSPASYDDYKEEDVILDPFYHDVPKLKQTRRKRNIVDNDDVIRDEQEAADLLRYLFNWYKKREKTKPVSIPISAEDITNINHQLAPLADTETTSSSEINYNEMFRRILNTTINGIDTSTTAPLDNNGYKNETSNTTMNNTDELRLTSKNHTRRSGLLQDVDYSGDLQYSQNVSNEIQLVKEIDNTTDYLDEYFNEENATVLQHLGNNQNISNDEYLEEFRKNVTTTLTTDIPVESTTVKNVTTVPVSDYYYYSENDDYYDYLNPAVESEAKNTTENTILITTTEQPMNVSDYFELYGNDTLYEDLESEGTTTVSPDVGVTMLPIPTIVEEAENSTEESKTRDQEKYSYAKENVIDLTNEKKHTDKFETVEKEVYPEPVREVTKSEEFPMFTISDYVDDNYEALTYPIHQQMNGTSGGLTTTPQYDSLTSNFKEIEPSTELEKVVIIDLPKSASEPSVTVQTDLPTTLSPETTIVTEGAIQFSTDTVSTEIITEATRVTSVSSTATDATSEVVRYVTTEMKEDAKPNRFDYSSRHRFDSINRKRGRGRFNFQTEPEPVLNTVNDTMNNTESSSISYFTNETSTAATIPKLKTTTIATERKVETTLDFKTETPITDAPLLKSANPTKAKYSRIILSTTPLTKVIRVDLKNDLNQLRYSFNCFNKNLHRFYSDPRDCRLFHYCTLGYTKNQLVDMKFVCDLGTYYDEEKFICTKEKPARCP
ncbi:hypothetical protein RI129_006400 [Pyrocoelia pectoralis]|uniref:Chitin-binding type-2 domain-containing protein n=1 Tax=Pyrocoelia pectoralis TaxID=417401 RepID=A0AAN7VAM6_9COLE